MDIEQALNRVIELAFKWQQEHEWTAAFKAADRFREYRDKCTERFDELSELKHNEVISAHSEFIELENLLRLHAPQLLELVPGVNFFTDSATDHSQQIRDLKKLEGASRKLIRPVPVESNLPFGLQPCDVPQTLKRAKHNPVAIENIDYWKLMEALMAAAPNAVPESKLNLLFPYKNDRENAPKKLRDIIYLLGLTVKKWTLMELEN